MGDGMKGFQRKQGMNQLEKRYAEYLDLRRSVGEIKWWGYEIIKIKLAPNTYYTPDFMVLDADNNIEIHEVKGIWRDDARVKFKVASTLFPAKFVAITWNSRSKCWEMENLV
jgi:hypothetical protein